MLWKQRKKRLSCHQNHNNYVSKIITAWCVIHLIPSDRESSLPADKSNCWLAEIWYKINHRAQALCPLEFYQIKANSTPKMKLIAMSSLSVCCGGIFKKCIYLHTYKISWVSHKDLRLHSKHLSRYLRGKIIHNTVEYDQTLGNKSEKVSERC